MYHRLFDINVTVLNCDLNVTVSSFFGEGWTHHVCGYLVGLVVSWYALQDQAAGISNFSINWGGYYDIFHRYNWICKKSWPFSKSYTIKFLFTILTSPSSKTINFHWVGVGCEVIILVIAKFHRKLSWLRANPVKTKTESTCDINNCLSFEWFN